MQVKELMTEKVRAVGADATVRQAAQEMAQSNVGALPVARDRKLVGMVTDRDITVRALGKGLNPDETTVEQVMSSDVLTLSADQDVADAGRAMRDRQIRRAPVMNDDQQLVGIISLGDLAVKSGDAQLIGEVLKGISEPAAPNLR
jgi:CBS domain-containing protein